ncbi:MAG TPA: flagellar hook-basal body complex protein FliE [Marmoricola sp.]|jgi:flagellar hook-basal body complex protein FliE|nr:flagellar hook-basal body complex protein FliE [Marmoricola sp.]
MSVSGIEGFTPLVPATLSSATIGSTATDATASTSGKDFGGMVLDGIDRLESVQDKSSQLAVKAATGDLTSIHDYTIAASEASVTTQLTVALRNKAVDAFNEIMRMQV